VFRVTSDARLGYEAMSFRIDPEPPEAERDAILAALAETPAEGSSWAEAARLEAVAAEEAEP
jgi:hypothetical protein